MKPVILISVFLLAALSANAQMMYYPDNSVRVFSGSKELTLAWAGGFNNPQFSMGDINNDGLQDLVIYEPGKGVKTFINKGAPGNPDYRYYPQFEKNFAPSYSYMVLADYNRDRIPDLFERGLDGFAVHKGYYNASNELCFTFYQDLFYYNDLSSGGGTNAFCNPGDIPGIADLDNDGDLDFIAYNIVGGTINYYRNMQVENSLPTDSIRVFLRDRCWGKVYQAYWREHMLHYSCNNSGLLREAADTTGGKKTHSGNTPCLFDWDMDGDYDYLDGSVSFNELTFLKNGRIEHGSGPDSMVAQDTMWQAGGKRVVLPVWPTAFNIDIDQDGKKDLLIAPNLGGASENYKCIWFYKNLTTAGSPNWQFQSDSFLTDKTIDLGTAAFPMLFDYNMDGKPDLFLGSDGYRQASGILRSRISYYKNTSTSGSPSFTLQTTDFLNIDTFGFQGTAPAFGDIDNDGKADMLIGHTDGTLTYYKNIASSATAQPVWHPAQVILQDNAGVVINVDGHAAPFIYDIDKDGKKDLVIGNLYGTIQYYRNVSTSPGTISLQLVNLSLGGAQVDPTQSFGNYSTPFIGKLDASGRDFLLMGSNSGQLYRFDSVGCGDTTVAYPLLNGQYSYIDTSFLQYNHAGSMAGAYGGLRSAPTVGDVDGDGEYEMIVGDVRGGVRFYKRKPYDNSAVPRVTGESAIINLYPNPAANSVNVSWSGNFQSSIKLSIINMQGQLVSSVDVSSSLQTYSIPLGGLPEGVYICMLQSGDNRYYQRVSVLR